MKTSSASCMLLLIASAVVAQPIEVVQTATIVDSPTTLLGVNHIGLSVKDLETALAFYRDASGFAIVRREVVKDNAAADELYGRNGIEYDVAVLRAPNMLFELRAFAHNADRPTKRMPVQGPGMTHTCFQTAADDSGYERFRRAGADMLSRGDEPIDLAGRGVTYAYGYDPEGNMFEMEQLAPAALARVPAKERWIREGQTMWMTQVAFASHDLDRLTAWFRKVLAFPPYRAGDFVEHPGMIDITDEDGLSLRVSWFLMSENTKTLELWQMRVPETQEYGAKRDVTEFGYSYSIEVGDIHSEFERMKDLGVEFVSSPVRLAGAWHVYGHDIDGNAFSLRQWIDPESPFSVRKLDR